MTHGCNAPFALIAAAITVTEVKFCPSCRAPGYFFLGNEKIVPPMYGITPSVTM